MRLDLRAAALGLGDSGSRAITPGKADESELIRRVETDDAEERMPPKSDPLGRDEIGILRAWIDQGAAWPETAAAAADGRRAMVVTAEDRRHWSYRPLSRVDPPASPRCGLVPHADRPVHPRRPRGPRHSPECPADRRTLIRRVYFDLLGLPPTPEEVEAFVADPAPDAYEELVDRLLASPHYGERWGRHWLDVARYADSDGLRVRRRPADRVPLPRLRHPGPERRHAVRPFVRWQIAGDEYEPDDPRRARGHRLPGGRADRGADGAHGGGEAAAPVQRAGRHGGHHGLGLARPDARLRPLPRPQVRRRSRRATTTGCNAPSPRPGARTCCSRHGPRRPGIASRSRDGTSGCKAAQDELNAWLAEQKKPHTRRPADCEDRRPGDQRRRRRRCSRSSPTRRPAKKLAKQHEKALAISDDDYRRVFTDEQRRRWDALAERARGGQAVASREARRRPWRSSTGRPSPSRPGCSIAGDFYAKNERLQVGFLTVLTGVEIARGLLGRRAPGDRAGSQHRPATGAGGVDHRRRPGGRGRCCARVMVNRVWQHHFGEGLVRTVGDFGVRGERPTHPELLEWLAHEFVAGGWRLKPLHRLILTSAAYTAGYDLRRGPRGEADPDNRLLWRRRPQRLEAEVLRDAVLSVSGTLNPRVFGPAFKPPIPPEAMLARNTKDPYPKDARDTPRDPPADRLHVPQAGRPAPADAGVRRPGRGRAAAAAATSPPSPRRRWRCSTTVPARPRRRLRAAAAGRGRRRPRAAGSIAAYELALVAAPERRRTRGVGASSSTRRSGRRSARDKSSAPDELRLQALTDFCQVLFSLNEFIYVD